MSERMFTKGLGEMNDFQRRSCSHVRCRHFASWSCSEWCVNTSRWAWAFHCFLVDKWSFQLGHYESFTKVIEKQHAHKFMNIPLLKFLEATKKMRVCTPCSTVLGGHQLGWSLGNEFSGERFGTSACLSERSRLAQKGPRFKSFFSDTFFFQEKKTGKKIWWSMCSPFVSVQLQRHVQARVMSLPLMEQLKACSSTARDVQDVEGSIWVRNSGHSIPNYPFGVILRDFPYFLVQYLGWHDPMKTL